MTEMVMSGSMSGDVRRSDGLLGESGHERRRSQQAPPVLYATARVLDSTQGALRVALDLHTLGVDREHNASSGSGTFNREYFIDRPTRDGIIRLHSRRFLHQKLIMRLTSPLMMEIAIAIKKRKRPHRRPSGRAHHPCRSCALAVASEHRATDWGR